MGHFAKLFILPSQVGTNKAMATTQVDETQLWHQRLGHLGIENMKKLQLKQMIKDWSAGE